jgi:hypothetical protein
MTEDNQHFISVDGWAEAAAILGFEPLRPRKRGLAFRIHVMDHRNREVAPTLEVDFDGFVLSQADREPAEAARLAAERYGPDSRVVSVGNHEALLYELGPEPDPDDVDPRSPAVVTWADGRRFVFVASDRHDAADLLEIATSLYPAP